MEKISFTHLGYSLNGNSWLKANHKAIVVLFTGMEEHVSRYDCMANYFNDHGYSFLGLDTFGQGENVDKDLSNIGVWPKNGFEIFLKINNAFIEELKVRYNVPVYIFAHSMGSFMGQGYIEMFPSSVDKIVLCGSGAKNAGVPIIYPFAKLFIKDKNREQKSKILNKVMFGNFNAKIKNPRTSYDWLSHDEKEVDKYIADPLCGFGPNKGFCLEFLYHMKRLYKKKALTTISKSQEIFLIGGEQDPVTGYGKLTLSLNKMYTKLGVNKVSYKIFTDLRHEIHNEKERNEVFESILSFYVND